MPEIVLQRSRIDALVRQLVAAGMPEHVRMDGKPNSAASPSRAIISRNPRTANGAPRSDVNTNDDDGSCSRLSRRLCPSHEIRGESVSDRVSDHLDRAIFSVAPCALAGEPLL